MTITNRRPEILLPLLMLNLILLSKAAQAAAIYDAQASVTLTILAIRSEVPAFNLAGEVEVFSEDTEALGGSFADAFGYAAAAPLPSSFALMALGLSGLLMAQRRWT